MADCIQVFARSRKQEGRSCIDARDKTNEVVLKGDGDRVFTFDRVFANEATQEDVFKAVGKPIADACLAGYNGTIFAYGQTGAGKTHTMYGPPSPDQSLRGVAPRVFEYLFAHMKRETATCDDGELTFDCRGSFLEIYNENLTDLLVPPPDPKAPPVISAAPPPPLKLRDDPLRGMFVEGMREEVLRSSGDAQRILAEGMANRHVGATDMNEASSRSHSVFTLLVTSVKKTADGLCSRRCSRLHLVDLAGSERQRDTSSTGVRLKEACSINRSLSQLGNVITALVTGAPHVAYRDSKLTLLLKDSLGGNAKTCIVANVSELERFCAETLGTLKFAQRAKMIRNKAVVNEDTTGSTQAAPRTAAALPRAHAAPAHARAPQLRATLSPAGAARRGGKAQTAACRGARRTGRRQDADEVAPAELRWSAARRRGAGGADRAPGGAAAEHACRAGGAAGRARHRREEQGWVRGGGRDQDEAGGTSPLRDCLPRQHVLTMSPRPTPLRR